MVALDPTLSTDFVDPINGGEHRFELLKLLRVSQLSLLHVGNLPFKLILVHDLRFDFQCDLSFLFTSLLNFSQCFILVHRVLRNLLLDISVGGFQSL